MRNLKKVLSLALALVMLLGLMMVGAGAVDTGFADDAAIKDDFKTAAAINKALGLMTGNGTNLNPTANITRAEAFILSLRVDGSNANEIASRWPVSVAPFNDVTAGKWYAPYLAYGKEMGLISGSNGSYNPDGNITVVEYSILMLKKLGFDSNRYTGANWNTNAASDALEAGLYEGLGNVNYYTHQLTRQEACQMAFNAITYSPEGEKTVYTVNGLTFDSAADAYFYSQGNGTTDGEGNITYPTVGMTTVYPGSLAEKVFGLNQSSGSANDVDEFGRPSTVWTADKYNLELTIPDGVSYTYTGRVANRTVRAALGAGVLRYSNWTEVVDGVTTSGTAPANNSSAFAGSQAGSVTEVYVDTDAKSVTTVTINTYVGEVTRVTAARGSAKRTVTVTGGATFATEDFAKGDVVLYTKSEDTIKTMELAEEVTGTLTRKVVGNSTAAHVYTVGGTEYRWSGTPTATDIAQNRIGSDVTLYVDQQGNIVKVKGVANQPDRYIYILANPSAAENPDYITGVKDVVEVYGVLSDGTVGKYNVKSVVNNLGIKTDGSVGTGSEGTKTDVQCVVSSNSNKGNGNKVGGAGTSEDPYTYEKYVAKGALADKVYKYTLDGNGYLTLTAEIQRKNSEEFDNNDRTVNTKVDPSNSGEAAVNKVMNSSTVFVFVETEGGENKTVKNVTMQTGIANIGRDIAEGSAFMADKDNVATVVFVSTAYSAGVEDTGDLVYVTGVTTIQTSSNRTEVIVDGIDENGEEVEIETSKSVNVGEVWSLGAEGDLANKQTVEEVDVLEVNGNNIRVKDGNTRYFVTEDTKLVDLTDGGLDAIAVGQRLIIVNSAVSGKEGDIRVAFITEAASEGTLEPEVSTVPEADREAEGENSNKPGATVDKVIEVGTGESFQLPSGTGNVSNDSAIKVNDNVIIDWGDVDLTQGFTFPIKKGTGANSDKDKFFVIAIMGDDMTVQYMEQVKASGKVATGVFYFNFTEKPALTDGNYFWSVLKYDADQSTSLNGTTIPANGTEVAHGNFSWEVPEA